MQLQMNIALTQGYSNASQKARVITEAWVANNAFCPRCGNPRIMHFENNKPVADFYCPKCGNQYELKSKNGLTLGRINDGAYTTMIDRITSLDNPDFFFMSYSATTWQIRNFFFVPKHFFTPEIIKKRTPLSSTARRAGWTGCIILLDNIPATGKIPIIKNGAEIDKETIIKNISRADNLKVSDIGARGWLLDVLFCVERIPNRTFTLSEMYDFENELAIKHPNNRNIKPKIRQQLQILRDKGIIAFVRHGEYRKVV